MIGKVSIYLILIVAAVCGFLIFGSAKYDVVPLGFFEESEPVVLTGFSAPSWAVFDVHTGNILFGENTSDIRPIASITKLFTAYAAVESDRIDDEVVITWADLNTEGRAGKLAYGDRLTVRELLFPLLIESSNDAGEAIRRTLGSDFEIQMTLLTKELALSGTTIADGSGLGSRNLSSPNDLAKFYAHLFRNHQHILDITKLKVYIGEDNGWTNTDPATEYDNFNGGKNGYTYEAGRTFLGSFKTGGKQSKDIGLVLLGSTDIAADIGQFTEYVREAY